MKKKQNNIIIFILIFFSITFYFNKINDPVKNRHAWALADHFAISLGFLNNDFDFFHPETFCLNPQFPANKTGSYDSFWTNPIENAKGITAIDFPIHHYIIAKIMYLSNTTQTYIFRLYVLLFSLLGLFYLFKSAFYVTSSFYFSLFIMVFVMLSPTFSYYAIGFLPSQIAFSILFISFYHYLKYDKTKNKKYFYYCIILLTTASLTRFPFLIYTIAFFCFYLLFGMLHKNFEWKKILVCCLSIGIVLSYFFFNKLYLFENFGSNFLNHPIPVTSIQIFVDSIKGIIYHQSWRYFTLVHYLCICYLVLQLIKNKSEIKINFFCNKSILYLSICTIGVFCYILLMLPQFVAHEYYMYDTFLPIMIFWTLASYRHLKFKITRREIILFCLFAIFFNKVVYHFGYAERKIDLLKTTRTNFEFSYKILDSLKINEKAKILLLDSYSPNLAFINMNRKGYCVMDVSNKIIKESLTWNFDYIITQNFSYQSKVLKAYPNFEKETKIFFSNDKFTIHTKK